MKNHPTMENVGVTESGVIYRGDKVARSFDEHGYRKVRLYGKSYYVHRLVAETYVSNPEGHPFVNHLDCDKANNNVDNLEWVTHQMNIIHAGKNGRMKAKTASWRQWTDKRFWGLPED